MRVPWLLNVTYILQGNVDDQSYKIPCSPNAENNSEDSRTPPFKNSIKSFIVQNNYLTVIYIAKKIGESPDTPITFDDDDDLAIVNSDFDHELHINNAGNPENSIRVEHEQTIYASSVKRMNNTQIRPRMLPAPYVYLTHEN